MTSSIVLRSAHLAIAAIVVALDVLTKLWAETALPAAGGSIVVFPGWLSMTLVHNTGAAFGIFSSADPGLTTAVLNVIGLAAIVVVALYARSTPADRTRAQIALALVFGGALGNLGDRLTRGYVVDFVEVYWKRFHWPNFNVADSAICVGVALLLIDSILSPDPDSGSSDREEARHLVQE